METTGQAPLSPSEGQIPPVKHKTPFAWVIRRARNTGHPQAVLRLPGTNLHHRGQLLREHEGRPERRTINPSPGRSPRCAPSDTCAETDAAAPGRDGKGGTSLSPGTAMTRALTPLTATGRLAGHRHVRDRPGHVGPGRHAASPRPAPPAASRGPAPPSSPSLCAQRRLTVKAPNHRHLLPLPRAAPTHPPANGCCVIRRVTAGAVARWLRRRRPPAARPTSSLPNSCFREGVSVTGGAEQEVNVAGVGRECGVGAVQRRGRLPPLCGDSRGRTRYRMCPS